MIVQNNKEMDYKYEELNKIRDEYSFRCIFLIHFGVNDMSEEEIVEYVLDQEKEMSMSLTQDLLSFNDKEEE